MPTAKQQATAVLPDRVSNAHSNSLQIADDRLLCLTYLRHHIGYHLSLLLLLAHQLLKC